jgi:monoamine oxidase
MHFKYFEPTVKGLLRNDANELSLFYHLDYNKSEGPLENLRSENRNGAQFQRIRQFKSSTFY